MAINRPKIRGGNGIQFNHMDCWRNGGVVREAWGMYYCDKGNVPDTGHAVTGEPHPGCCYCRNNGVCLPGCCPGGIEGPQGPPNPW